VNFCAPIFVKDYAPTPELNVAFMAVLGVLLATKNDNNDSDGTAASRHKRRPA
jgi:hypothetical protein